MKSFRHGVLSDRSLSGGFRAIPQEPLPISNILSQLLDQTNSKVYDLSELFPRIFFTYRNPSPGDRNAMDLMLGALRSGKLRIRQEFISTTPDIPEDLIAREPRRGRTIESEEHKGLKWWVRKHLKSSGINVASNEVSKLGYEVDVGCLDRNLFVGCGDTEPCKVLDFLRNGLNIGVLQYDSEDIVWFLTSDDFRNLARLENFL